MEGWLERGDGGEKGREGRKEEGWKRRQKKVKWESQRNKRRLLLAICFSCVCNLSQRG